MGDSETLQRAFKDVNEIIQCPGCLTVPRSPPIYACSNDHILCSECRLKLIQPKCPTCKVLLDNKKSLLAEQLISKLPMTCKFKEEGCRFVSSNVEMSRHEKEECPKRLVKCIDQPCGKSLMISNFVDHVKIMKHAIEGSRTFLPSKYSFTLNSFFQVQEQDMYQNFKQWPSFHFQTFDDHHFYQCLIRKDNLWFTWMYVIRPPEVPDKYKCKLIMRQQNKDTESSWLSECIPVENNPVESFLQGHQHCSVFLDTTAMLFLNGENLVFEIQIDNSIDNQQFNKTIPENFCHPCNQQFKDKEQLEKHF